MKLGYKVYLIIIIYFLRYAYLDSKLHKFIYTYIQNSSYLLLGLILAILFPFKKCNTITFVSLIIIVLLGRVLYRHVTPIKITNNSKHTYNNLLFLIGISSFILICL